MTEPVPSQPLDPATDFVRIRHERQEADRTYNDALTALDRAIQTVRAFPPAPTPFDESQLPALNERWPLLPHKPAVGGGWLGRLRTHIWAMVAPVFQQQQDFNATLVDHLNRNAASQRESAAVIEQLLVAAREELARLVDFQSLLVQYAQTVTAFVDTRDRSVEAVPHELKALTNALGDEMQKRWESLGTRDRRFQSEVDEVRTTLGVAHRAILTLKRELVSASAAPGAPAAAPASASALNAYKYVGFEDQFRGSPAEIRERMASYVADFDGCADVLDIGCGRGEFLDLLRERGISARGVDLNDEMVGICRDRGLDATTLDALSYLEQQPDGSLGGLFGAQIVEHLEPDYLLRLLETAFHKLRPGAVVVLETVNPACWFAFFSSYIRDITHVRPLHPDTLRYLMLASGFQTATVRYAAPFPDASKLQPVSVAPENPLAETAAVINENMSKLNGLLFTFLDYAVIARRA
jgi:O-antigen chain-terminating methyltransferase